MTEKNGLEKGSSKIPGTFIRGNKKELEAETRPVSMNDLGMIDSHPFRVKNQNRNEKIEILDFKESSKNLENPSLSDPQNENSIEDFKEISQHNDILDTVFYEDPLKQQQESLKNLPLPTINLLKEKHFLSKKMLKRILYIVDDELVSSIIPNADDRDLRHQAVKMIQKESKVTRRTNIVRSMTSSQFGLKFGGDSAKKRNTHVTPGNGFASFKK